MEELQGSREGGDGGRIQKQKLPYLGDVHVRLGVESSSAADDDEGGGSEQLGDQGATEAGGGGQHGAPAQGVAGGPA